MRRSINSLYYYNLDNELVTNVLCDDSTNGANALTISNSFFSPNNKYLFFGLRPTSKQNDVPANSSKVDVWHYKDSILQSTQLMGETIFTPGITYTWVYNIKAKKVIKLEQTDEVISVRSYSSSKADYVSYCTISDLSKEPWWPTAKDKLAFLVSLQDGSREILEP